MRAVEAAVAALMLAASAGIAPVSAQAPTPAQQRAYALTVVCNVVAAYFRNPADIHRTADALRRIAAVMGYDSARMARDVSGMAAELGVALRHDSGVMDRHRGSCRQLGLIS